MGHYLNEFNKCHYCYLREVTANNHHREQEISPGIHAVSVWLCLALANHPW